MSIVKDSAIRIIESLPDDCDYEDIQHHLYLWEKVQNGEREIAAGRFVSHDEAKRKLSEWLQSTGLTQR